MSFPSLTRLMRRLRVAGLAVPVLVLPLAADAQIGTVTGKVTDAASKAPIDGARIQITGTTLGTQTNASGDYRLTAVRAGMVQITVLRLGYKSMRDSVRLIDGQTATLNFALQQSAINLSEVVVTGTAGNQERKAQSALVASVSAADIIRDAPVTNVASMLQSRVPGVSLSTQSGTRGVATQIRIRGASSINLSNQPLVFIDGVRLNEGFVGANQSGQQFDRFNDLNPEEIESIEVVKGPAAATLYGADASAGVIQIISKKGKAGSNTFAQSMRIEQSTSDKNFEPLDNFALCTAALITATSTNPLCRGKAVGDLVNDNPLQRVNAFQTGKGRIFSWNGRGGGQNFGYNLSYGSDNTAGVLPNNRFNRYNVRSNGNYIANSKLSFDAALGLVQSQVDLPDNDNNIFGWLGGAMLGSPLTRNDSPTGQASNDGWFARRHYNAIAAKQNRLLTKRVITSITANYAPTTWFTNRLIGGMDFGNEVNDFFQPKNDSLWWGGLNDGGNRAQGSRGAERYTFEYSGNMKKNWASSIESNLSFGLQVISSRNQLVNSTGTGFVTNANNSVNSAAINTGGSAFTEQRQYGYFSQLQLGSANRRFIQIGARVDRNSSFGQQSPSFFLPKIGGTWTLSEESFFEPLTGVVNQFRVRASWGSTGRSPGPGDALTTLASAAYNITGTAAAGVILGNPGNADLKPERGTEFEAGLDASFFDNRVGMELTYFNKKTRDLIINRPIPPSLGFNANPLANLGEVVNSGLELGVNVAALNMANAKWDIRLGANTLHNELLSLGGVNPFALGGAGRTLVGQQVGVYVSKKIQSIDLAANRVTVSDTLTPLGNLFPTLEWNITNTVTLFKNFRIAALLDAKRDYLIQNNTAFFRETQIVVAENRINVNKLSPTERLRRYGNLTPGQPAFVQVNGQAATVNDVQEAYLESGDFTRLREVSATYTLPNSLLGWTKNRVSNLSATLALQNVMLWTNYSGFDPEVNSQTGPFSRQDFLTLPNTKTTVLRLNLNF